MISCGAKHAPNKNLNRSCAYTRRWPSISQRAETKLVFSPRVSGRIAKWSKMNPDPLFKFLKGVALNYSYIFSLKQKKIIDITISNYFLISQAIEISFLGNFSHSR